ncbi:MAG: flagellar biosynthesis protein FlhB [Ignavibacteriales bacterium]
MVMHNYWLILNLILNKAKNKQLMPNSGFYSINLQLFADEEKTEKATPKKRQDARQKGQVFKSKEINSAVLLLAMFLTLKYSCPMIYEELFKYTQAIFNEYMKRDIAEVSTLMNFLLYTLTVFGKVMLPILLVSVLAGLISGYAQVGFLFTLEPLRIKLEKLNPITGIKNMFSRKSLVELVKSFIKISVSFYVAYLYLKGEAQNVSKLVDMDVINIVVYIGNVAINVSIGIIVILIILAVFDYIFEWWDYERNLRMSKHELKEEYKQTEGNPLIKSKIKQKQRQLSASRMMKEIPKADVVITNPTHFAVAIKYEPEKSAAPVVLAKGQDYLALRIKEVAKENRVEIVENKPLARTLYSTVEIGEAIPEELYQAVAEVLAFVYSLKDKKPAV